MLQINQLVAIYNEATYYLRKQLIHFMNQINLDNLVKDLNQLNIIENYLIGIVLSLITLILWCLLRRKTRKQDHQIDSRNSSANNSFSQLSQIGKQKPVHSKQSYDDDDIQEEDDEGHLSDSALSFFSRLGTQTGPRFRKRDKLFFYGKKMLRTVSHVRGSISARSAEKYKKINKILSKIRNLNLRNEDSIPALYRRTEPPQFLLDTESGNQNNMNNDLPTALINLIRSVKVFGYFDQRIILEMCKYMETKTVYANNYLFKIGDPDDSIYVVESGRVHVYITDEKGRKHLIKECTEGNHIFSLLSIMDVLIGDLKPYKTVSAKAVEDTSILRLPGRAFVDVLQKYPDYLVRITQIIIVRLQRVTFTALHNYLGLTSEMIRMSDHKKSRKILHSKLNAESEQSQSKEDDQSDNNNNQKHHVHHHHHHHHHHRHNSPKEVNQMPVQTIINKPITRLESVEVQSESDIFTDDSKKLPPISFFTEQSEPNVKHHHKHRKSTTPPMAVPNQDQTLTMGDEYEDQQVAEQGVYEPESKEPDAKDFKLELTKLKYTAGANTAVPQSQLNVGSVQSTNSYEMDSATSSDDEQSNGSEFGECVSSKDLKNKLPQVEKDIAEMLKLKDASILRNKINIIHVSEGTILCKEGDYNCSLLFVLDGLLYATQKELNGEESTIFYCQSKQFCANLSVLSGEPALFSFKAKQNTELAFITKENFHKIIAAQPNVVLSVAHLIVKRMSPFVRQIDFALEWNLIESGNALFRQNYKAENIYIVLNGRFRSILKTNETHKQLVGEYGRGDLVGIVEILMETNNATTVVAIRDTEVAQIPSGLLNYIKYRHPRVVTRLIQMLSSKLLGTIQNVPSTPYIDSSISLRQPIDAPTIVSNLCTVAIMPVSDDVPLHAFTLQLCHALNAIDSTLLLTKDFIVKKLGPSALERVNEYRLCAWLGQQEDHHRIVLYQCEYRLTPWTRRCMRQADCLLIVGLASKEPAVGQLEKEIDNFAIRAQKELILLHKMDGSRPMNTVKWLNMRSWCTSHHHIRCPDSVFKTGTNERLIKVLENDLIKEKVDKMTDFSRLARFLTGTSIGVVLGGGGARGSAHVGMIKAMIEANIPIDMIGGTSIGSFMGALWAEENNYDRFFSRAYEWAMKMTSYGKQIADLTYPVTSMFTGHAFNKSIEDVFCNRQIEDLWIPYFCVTTDISASKMRIHMNGVLWRYIRASMTYCWLFPPICDPLDGHLLVDGCYVNNLPGSCWRYVRSSMSLSGYLPPLCDPIDGHLLLDGGYVNNLPADVMHRMGVNTVLAIDVGSKDDDNFTNYGDQLSGWWLLWKKWNHWATPVKVPDLTEIQSRLAYVSCMRGLEMVKNSDFCEYMRPPIDKFRTLQFASFEEIRECGYNYGKILFDTWIKHAGSIEKFLYRKMNQNNSPNRFSNKSKEMNIDTTRIGLGKLKGNYNNNYQFEDLSQFVISQQTRQQNDQQIVKLNSILKNGLTQSDIDEKKMPDVQRKYKHSKSVQINNDDSIYEQLYNLISNGDSNTDGEDEYSDFDEDDEQWSESLENAIKRLKKNTIKIVDYREPKQQTNLSSSLPELSNDQEPKLTKADKQPTNVNNTESSKET